MMILYKTKHSKGGINMSYVLRGLVFSSAFTVLNAQAQTLNTEVKQAPNQSASVMTQASLKALFQQGKTLYDQAVFDKAYPVFEQLVKLAPSSKTFNFYLGRSAFETQRFDSAIAAFDRVLMLEPNHLRTRLEMARVYFVLEQFDLAAIEVNAVLAVSDQLPPRVRQTAEKFAQRIQTAMNYSPHTHKLTLVLGADYDSNVNNDLGGSADFELPGLENLTVNGRDEVKDYAFSQTLLYEHDYDFGARGGWHWQTKALGLNKNQRDVSTNDLQYVSLQTGLGLRQAKGAWSLPLTVDRVYLDGKTYVSNLSFGLDYEYAVLSNVLLQAGYSASLNDYAPENEARNAYSHSVDFGIKSFWGKKTPWVLGVEAKGESRQQRATHPTDPASMKEYTLRASLSKVLDENWRIDSGLMRRWSQYDAQSVLFENQRSDQINHFDFGVGYKLNASSSLSLTASRAIHKSNQGVYQYDKDRAGLRYIFNF